MTKLFIDGEHGTTGLQIREQMTGNANFELLQIAHEHRHDVARREEMLNEADFAILCLPDDAARQAVQMAPQSTRIIDTSTAHRTHEDWAYGFAEALQGQADKIANSRLVANPGCYPTGALGFIAPLVKAGILPRDYPISINAVSGYTGGGKALVAQMENASAEDHIDASHFIYALGLSHKHLSEIITHGSLTRTPIFAPSVARFAQGMAVQIPLHLELLASGTSRASLHSALCDHYSGLENSGQAIVRVAPLKETDAAPRLLAEELAGTDRMTLHVTGNDEAVNLVALLDNLGKGASGAAIQNLNLMCGL